MLGAAHVALLGPSFASGVTGTTVLSRPETALWSGQDPDPASDVLYIATDGDDGSGDGSVGNPYATLEGAHADPNFGPGWTIVLRGGTYARSGPFAPSKSGTSGRPITVKAAEGETVILDWAQEFDGFRTPGQGLWEVEDASIALWRSVSTGFGSTARLFGHWEEAGEWWHLYGYKNDGTKLNDGTGTGVDYFGPGCWIGADGRVHLRFQRPHPAHVSSAWPDYQPGCSGGNWIVPGTEDPNDYSIWLTRWDNGAALNHGINGSPDHWVYKDINIQGRTRILNTPGPITGLCIERGLWRGPLVGIRKQDAANDLLFSGVHAVKGRMDYFTWQMMKGVGVTGSTEMDDEAFFNSRGGGGSGNTVEDCLVRNFFDFFSGGFTPDADIKILHNWIDNCHDDLFQISTSTNGVEIGWNVLIDTPINGWDLSGGSSSGDFYLHHNVCWLRLPRIWNIGAPTLGPHSAGVSHWNSGASNRTQPRKIYNNTVIVNGGYRQVAAFSTGHCDGESINDTVVAHEVYNNLFMVYADRSDWDAGQGDGNRDGCVHHTGLDGTSNELLDHNHYARVLAYTTPHRSLIGPFYNRPVRSGGPYFFESVSELANAGANAVSAEANGTDEEHVDTGVAGMNAAASLVDLEGLDLRPKPGSALASGAKDLSGTGWPGATADAWRGALDPAGDSSEVGPRSTT